MQSQPLIEEKRQNLEGQIKAINQEITKLRRVNRNWDASLTVTTIVLTLCITVFTTLDQIDEQNRKIVTGILGGFIVAIQSIGNAFPVKQRAGSYRLLQARSNNLLYDVKYVEDLEELKNIEFQFYQLQDEAAKVENQ